GLEQSHQASGVAWSPPSLQIEIAPPQSIAVFEQPRRLRPLERTPAIADLSVDWQAVALQPRLVERQPSPIGRLDAVGEYFATVGQDRLGGSDVIVVAMRDQ